VAPSRIEELRRRVQADPASIAFAQLAEEYRRSGQTDEAVRVCREGLTRHPGYLSARVTLGRALLDLGQLADARGEFEFVVAEAPENLAAVRGLAEIYQRDGNFAEALTYYRRALALARHDPEIEEIVKQLSRQVGVAAAGGSNGLTFEEAHRELLSAAERVPVVATPAPPPRRLADAPTAPFDFDRLVAALGTPAAPPQVEAVVAGTPQGLALELPETIEVGPNPFAALEAELLAHDARVAAERAEPRGESGRYEVAADAARESMPEPALESAAQVLEDTMLGSEAADGGPGPAASIEPAAADLAQAAIDLAAMDLAAVPADFAPAPVDDVAPAPPVPADVMPEPADFVPAAEVAPAPPDFAAARSDTDHALADTHLATPPIDLAALTAALEPMAAADAALGPDVAVPVMDAVAVVDAVQVLDAVQVMDPSEAPTVLLSVPESFPMEAVPVPDPAPEPEVPPVAVAAEEPSPAPLATAAPAPSEDVLDDLESWLNTLHDRSASQ
jgi:tetratricopeptide (TPR) repeat protein